MEHTDTDVQKYKRECMRDRHAEERNGWQNSKNDEAWHEARTNYQCAIGR